MINEKGAASLVVCTGSRTSYFDTISYLFVHKVWQKEERCATFLSLYNNSTRTEPIKYAQKSESMSKCTFVIGVKILAWAENYFDIFRHKKIFSFERHLNLSPEKCSVSIDSAIIRVSP